MNPDFILAELRELTATWQAAGSRGAWSQTQADRVVELFADLDRHLSGGGHLPTGWNRGGLDHPTGATFERTTSYRSARSAAHRDPPHPGRAAPYGRDFG